MCPTHILVHRTPPLGGGEFTVLGKGDTVAFRGEYSPLRGEYINPYLTVVKDFSVFRVPVYTFWSNGFGDSNWAVKTDVYITLFYSKALDAMNQPFVLTHLDNFDTESPHL